MNKGSKVDHLMDTLVYGMNDSELNVLAEKISSIREGRQSSISLEDITAERLRDPHFKASVLSVIERATKQAPE